MTNEFKSEKIIDCVTNLPGTTENVNFSTNKEEKYSVTHNGINMVVYICYSTLTVAEVSVTIVSKSKLYRVVVYRLRIIRIFLIPGEGLM